MNVFKGIAVLAGISAMTASAPITAKADLDSQSAIGVNVDGQPINFTGTQPMEVHGSVLVPLRGVFEALGANVDYNSQTSTITASRGGRLIVLPLGSPTATINGQTAQLSQPAQVYNGTTLVPLRFVAEALGDYVDWSSATHVVTIQRDHSTPVASLPPPDRRNYHQQDGDQGQGALIVGTIQHVYETDNGRKIQVTVDGQNQIVELTRDATIVRGDRRANLASASISDLRPGDRVWLRENARGRATSVTALFGPDR
jgi:hypothetical protein